VTPKRIAVHYGGVEYAISGRQLEDVLAEIEAGRDAQEARWLEVAVGQGRSTPARLLLGADIPIAVWKVKTDGEHSPTEDEGDPYPHV
jgi:hypothetical protein